MKKLKNTIISFILIVCAIMLTACGQTPVDQLDSKVSVDTKGDYVAATKEDFTNYTESTGENYILESEINGIKMTMTLRSLEGALIDMSMDANAIITYSASEKVGMALKANMTMGGDGENFTISMSTYLKGDRVYCKESMFGMTAKIYYTLEEYELMSGESLLGEDEELSSMENFDFDEFLQEIGEYLDQLETPGSNITLEKCEKTSGNDVIKKLKLTAIEEIQPEENVTSVFVLVFKNDKLTGIYNNVVTNEVSTEVSIVPFNKAIEYPSFDGYVRATDIVTE